jgi:aminoglycoside phosphotransferase (APT) family kinase protein
MTDIQSAVQNIMSRALGITAEVEAFTRLSGGASAESFSFLYADHTYVLRRTLDSVSQANDGGIGHPAEASVIRAARKSGVLSPEIVAEILPSDGIGTGYIMCQIQGETNPAQILAAPPETLIHDLARELAAIHSIKPSADIPIPTLRIADGLDQLAAQFESYGGDRPILALALQYCRNAALKDNDPCLIHGDLRMGNVMVDAAGLTGVLDWELCHWGDYHEDLAYGCMAVWRFGHWNKTAFGLASLDDFLAAYIAQSGRQVDRGRFHFWLIYRTLWWALGCLHMAHIWRSGADRSLERAVIGRRTSENELDLMMLMDEAGPPSMVDADASTGERHKGEPSAAELIDAVSEWIASDIKAKSQGRERFLSAVAINALGIVKRDLLSPLPLSNRALCEEIAQGRVTLQTEGLRAKLWRQAIDKVSIDSPKYASLAKVQEKCAYARR